MPAAQATDGLMGRYDLHVSPTLAICWIAFQASAASEMRANAYSFVFVFEGEHLFFDEYDTAVTSGPLEAFFIWRFTSSNVLRASLSAPIPHESLVFKHIVEFGPAPTGTWSS
jgi:hypothetical protein